MIIRVLNLLFRQYRWKTTTIITALLLTGVLSGVGVVALFPLVASLMEQTGEESTGIISLFDRLFSFFQIDMAILPILIFIAVVFVIKAALTIYTEYLSTRIQVETEADRKEKLFGVLLNSGLNTLYKSKFGDVANVIIQETKMIGQLVDYATRLLTGIIHFIVFVAIVFLVSWQLTLVTGVLAFLVYFLAQGIFKKAEGLGRSITDINGAIQELVNYTLSGYRVVKSFVSEPAAQRQMHIKMALFQRNTIQLTVMESALRSVFEPLILLLVVFAYAAFEFDFAQLVTFVVALARMYGAVQTIQNTHYKMARHIASLDKYEWIRSDLEMQKDRSDGKYIFPGLEKEIEFRSVTYSYEVNDKAFQLGPLSLKFPKGSMVALVGPSGSGKSTCVDLIEGFIYPKSGEVMVDGRDLADFETKSFRRKIGYVSQDLFLVNDTIKNNILFHRKDVPERDLINACRLANAHEFISDLPGGYNSLLGEQGINLSGGQKQRIALARALLGTPDILILDEATSALDNEAEREVQNAIDSLSGSITIIIIAHRLSTVMNADHVYVLERGKIAEEGTYQELLATKGRLFDMHMTASLDQ